MVEVRLIGLIYKKTRYDHPQLYDASLKDTDRKKNEIVKLDSMSTIFFKDSSKS